MTSTFYVYYSVSAENFPAARRAVMAMFADLQAGTGVAGRLARRQDDPGTWMETYDHVDNAQDFAQALRSAEATYGLDKLIRSEGGRKTEIFVADVLEPGMQRGGTACA